MRQIGLFLGRDVGQAEFLNFGGGFGGEGEEDLDAAGFAEEREGAAKLVFGDERGRAREAAGAGESFAGEFDPRVA